VKDGLRKRSLPRDLSGRPYDVSMKSGWSRLLILTLAVATGSAPASAQQFDVTGPILASRRRELRPILDDLCNPKVSRVELLRRLDAFLQGAPTDRRDVEVVLRTEKVLNKMIADEVAKAKVAKPLHPSINEQIDDLIFQLRDTAFVPLYQGDFAPENTMWPDSTEGRLFAIGSRAVPQLIAALKDKSYIRSRCPFMGANTIYPYEPYEVRDVAIYILSSIAHFNLRIGWPKVDDDEESGWTETIDKANAWWSEVQNKGERQLALERIMSGGPDAPDLAYWLIRSHPDEARQTITIGIASATDERIKSKLQKSMKGLKLP